MPKNEATAADKKAFYNLQNELHRQRRLYRYAVMPWERAEAPTYINPPLTNRILTNLGHMLDMELGAIAQQEETIETGRVRSRLVRFNPLTGVTPRADQEAFALLHNGIRNLAYKRTMSAQVSEEFQP